MVISPLVCAGAVCQCSHGSAKSALIVKPLNVVVGPLLAPAATIDDALPKINIPPFGDCSSPSNPEVIAALGAPVPCEPKTSPPWVPGAPRVLIHGIPALTMASACKCEWDGVITILEPGQVTVNVSV